jgi:8-oxo-dGTP pyrophosphatase MutT (NUDIX family)
MAGRGTKQIAALCWRKNRGMTEILLITSRETKRWVIPKGWPMDGLKDYNAARLEAFEEAGVGGRVTSKSIGTFQYKKLHPTNGAKTLRVEVYALAVKTTLRKWPEKDERKRQWFSAEEAAAMVHEPSLKALILKLGKSP